LSYAASAFAGRARRAPVRADQAGTGRLASIGAASQRTNSQPTTGRRTKRRAVRADPAKWQDLAC
jgi:hypothetical protein